MSHDALIFSHSLSPRLQYLVDFLSDYYGRSFRLVYDEEKYKLAPDACKINYSYHRLADGEIFIHSHVLLFESSVRPVKAEVFEHEGYKAFFRTEGETGFDLFAAIFFLITRYEEYLPGKKDEYGRFAHEQSLASKEGFLHLPLVNIWLEDFRKLLAARNPVFEQPHSQFLFRPTYDIDMAWVYLHKGFRRNVGGTLLLFLKGRFGKMLHRIRVIRGKQQDPYDAYEWMDQLHNSHKLDPVYFFLVAAQTGKYDKNTDVQNEAFRELLRSLASSYEAGLHPSWASGDHPHLISSEKNTLEQITGKKIHVSRQHFIRFDLPVTYQRLISAGITDDYSMGYGTVNGFRASIASAFYWYDLKKEERTNLRVHPFCFMDANAYYEQRASPEAALEELTSYCSEVRKVNGTLITIWHNSFLGTAPEFEGWRNVYQRFIESMSTT